jgi:hypothetical protein
LTLNSKYEFFKVTWKNFRQKMCFDFFVSGLKKKAGDTLKRKLAYVNPIF